MIHVYPQDEEKDHLLGDDTTCPCGTRAIFDEDGNIIIVHTSFISGKSPTDADIFYAEGDFSI